MDERPELASDLLALYQFDLDHALFEEQTPAALRRAQLLITRLPFEPKSLFSAKDRKEADLKAAEAAKVAGELSDLDQAIQLAKQEQLRKDNEFEYFDWGRRDYKVNELIDSVRSLQHSVVSLMSEKPIPDPQPSRAPGDSLLAPGAGFVDEDDDDALMGAMS